MNFDIGTFIALAFILYGIFGKSAKKPERKQRPASGQPNRPVTPAQKRLMEAQAEESRSQQRRSETPKKQKTAKPASKASGSSRKEKKRPPQQAPSFIGEGLTNSGEGQAGGREGVAAASKHPASVATATAVPVKRSALRSFPVNRGTIMEGIIWNEILSEPLSRRSKRDPIRR